MSELAALAFALAVMACGKMDSPANDAGVPCATDQDCPVTDDALPPTCMYAATDGCGASTRRCFGPCPPGQPHPACGCDGGTVFVNCGYANAPIAHLGYCDGGL